jgi:xylitol oxidase
MIENANNWAGNYTYRAARLHRPKTVEQLQELVARGSKLRALGTRHSFNDIADSSEDLISLEHFNQIMELDREHHTVTIEAGVRYGELGRWLHQKGYALHNLASLPHISIAGACATGTHGSGDQNGNLAIVNGNGPSRW